MLLDKVFRDCCQRWLRSTLSLVHHEHIWKERLCKAYAKLRQSILWTQCGRTVYRLRKIITIIEDNICNDLHKCTLCIQVYQRSRSRMSSREFIMCSHEGQRSEAPLALVFCVKCNDVYMFTLYVLLHHRLWRSRIPSVKSEMWLPQSPWLTVIVATTF